VGFTVPAMESSSIYRVPFMAAYNDEFQPKLLAAPTMDRRDGSRSSMSSANSRFSVGSHPSQIVSSPGSSVMGGNEYDYLKHEQITPTPLGLSPYESHETESLSPAATNQLQENQELDLDLPLFDIERDGDPNIQWFMYYDFIVTKAEACWKLQPHYLVTERYPKTIKSEPTRLQTSDPK
jgi:hypothetical protein